MLVNIDEITHRVSPTASDGSGTVPRRLRALALSTRIKSCFVFRPRLLTVPGRLHDGSMRFAEIVSTEESYCMLRPRLPMVVPGHGARGSPREADSNCLEPERLGNMHTEFFTNNDSESDQTGIEFGKKCEPSVGADNV